MSINLHYTREGKSHDLTLQKVEKSTSEQKTIVIDGQSYSLGGDLEEAAFLASKIQFHQNIRSETLISRLKELGAEGIECPLLQTALKTKKLQTSHLPSSVPNASKVEKTHQLIDRHFGKELPGCNLVVMKDGQIIHAYSQGLADFEKKQKMDIDQRQHFGSVSKQFTAMAILLLVEEKKLNLDDDIHVYIPTFPVCSIGENKQVKLTIRNLLEMRSGLPEVLTYAFLAGKRDQDLTTQEKLDPLFKQKTIELAFTPNTDMVYCNTNYYLLSEIIPRVSGRTLKEYADQKIFGKLGMNHTSFIDPDRPVLEQSIRGYEVEHKVQECTTHNTTWGACGVIGTPRDMVLWDGNFTNNQLGKKSPQLIEELTALPKPPLQKQPLEYGKGLKVGILGNYKIECHSGGIEGFTTEFLRVASTKDPQDHLSFFLASNRNGDRQATIYHLSRELAQIWMEKPLFSTQEGPPPTPGVEEWAPTTKDELRTYQGVYQCDALRISYVCTVETREGKIGLLLKTEGGHEIFFLEKHQKSFFSPRDTPSAEFHFQPGKGFMFTDKSQGIINLPFTKRQA